MKKTLTLISIKMKIKNENVVISFLFSYAGDFKDGIAKVGLASRKDHGVIKYIDDKGNYINKTYLSDGRNLSNGLIAVKLAKKWGYMDKEGDIVIEIKYDEASSFQSGVAYVKKDGISCLINKKEECILSDIDVLCLSDENLHIIKKENEILMIDSTGKTVLNLSKYGYDYDLDKFEISNGMILFKVNEKYGYISTDGNTEIEAKYDDAKRFYNGFAAVEIDYKWGLIDKNGDKVLDLKYDLIRPISNDGILSCDKDGIWYILKIKEKGKT